MESIGNNLLNGYGGSPLAGGQNFNYPAQQAQGGMPFGGGDNLGSSYPPSPLGGMGGAASSAGLFAGFMNVMQGFMNQIAQMVQGLAGQQGATAGQALPPQQQYFTNASLSSTGDPHDAFNGTSAGQQISGKWDSMRSHNHLIASNAIPGGFNVATSTAPAQANGVTYNQSATITANRGNTVVTMGANGAYSVIDNGQAVALTGGQTSTLSNGETATLNKNGSLTVGVSNAQGGSISTTLSYNGHGVDVNSTANNIALGGYLAEKQDGWS
jgi:hypothetical protein